MAPSSMPLPAVRRSLRLLLALGLALVLSPTARGGELALGYQAIELPGAPAAVLSADLDGDGRRDLVVVVTSTRWDQIGIEESTHLDAVQGLVEVMTVVPALMDRRELRVFLGRPEGGFAATAAAMTLPPSVLSLLQGPPGLPVVALTDDGLSALRLAPGGEGGAPALSLDPILADRPALAGSGNFLPDLPLFHDLDGDGRPDLLLPAADGIHLYLATPGGLAATPAARLAPPAMEPWGRFSPLVEHYLLPEVRDVDGDGRPDLLLRHPRRGWSSTRIVRNLSRPGRLRFAPPVALVLARTPRPAVRDRNPGPEVVWVGDVDGDGRAEVVTQEEVEPPEDAGMRQELEHARRPPQVYRFYRLRSDLTMEPAPYQELTATGYAFAGDSDVHLPGGFQDLDGDGRQDLVTLTLDFSLFQAVRVLAVKRISIGLDFHLWCQRADGRLLPVPGLDLSGKFTLDLDNLSIGHLSQLSGDFDGDGKSDFLQMGRGRDVEVHRGGAGCVYAARPDLELRLREAPRDLNLVQVRDLDGDGRADLLIVQPQATGGERGEPKATPPVRLDLYLSSGKGGP